MSKVKLNLVSGSTQEKELITAFKLNDVKYVIFDGESTGSMGLPIILVGKENLGKVEGITDAEEWKNTKNCLKQIIAGEKIDYAAVSSELRADDIYYRQLTLPIASFDILKSSYKAPEEETSSSVSAADTTPIFEPITPEEVVGTPNIPVEPVVETAAPVIEPTVEAPVQNVAPEVSTSAPEMNYEEMKQEFLKKSEELFDSIFAKFNHKD